MGDYPELSLGLPSSQVIVSQSMSFSSSERKVVDKSRKRKCSMDHFENELDLGLSQTSIELRDQDQVPSDWEQCLDLETGRLFHFNRKNLKRNTNCHKEEKLNLELKISTLTSSDEKNNNSCEMLVESKKTTTLSSNNMFAAACLNCHLLVMLSKSSPSCPNCKCFNPLPTQQNPLPRTIKSLNHTLNLLN